MNEPASDVNTAQSRRMLYGVNLGLLVIVALMILVMIMIAIEKQKSWLQWDISSNAVNSLSGQSVQLLKDISEKKKNYHIVSMFTNPSNEEKSKGDPNKQAEKRQQVMDLLNLYRKQSSFVQVDDWGDRARDEIDREIREKYAGELKPYEEAVKGFDDLAQQVSKFAVPEAERLATAVQAGTATAEEREFAGQLQSTFRDLEPTFDDIQREIHRQTEATLPEWDLITANIKKELEQFDAFLELFADPEKIAQTRIPKSLLPYFTEANPRYKAISTTVKAYLTRLEKLPQLQVQDILSGVGRNTVIVLGPSSAKVLTRRDIFEDAPGETVGPRPTRFKGEEAVSSALLSMARPEKIKVVFVTSSPARIITDQYAFMAEQLRQSNFEVLEWSPPGGMTPDQPPDAQPPGQGKGTVWVVFPPEQQQQMMMMAPPDPRPVIAAVKKHMDAGGQVLFLAEAAGGGPLGMGGDKYAYEELLQPLGIQVKPKYAVVQHTDAIDPNTGARVERFEPYFVLNRYEDHVITNPMQGLSTVFVPSPSVTVVDVARPAPEGAEPKAIVRTPSDPNFWAESDISAKQPRMDPQSDIASPVPVVAISTKNRGKPEEQRVVVIGARMIGVDRIFEQVVPVQQGNQIGLALRFAGNLELFKNSILWLSGYENMIAVSAKSAVGARLTATGGQLVMLRTTMVLIIPLAILLLGALIWAVRRR